MSARFHEKGRRGWCFHLAVAGQGCLVWSGFVVLTVLRGLLRLFMNVFGLIAYGLVLISHGAHVAPGRVGVFVSHVFAGLSVDLVWIVCAAQVSHAALSSLQKQLVRGWPLLREWTGSGS